MCILSAVSTESTSAPAVPCPAKALPPQQRQQLAVHALAGTQPISHLAQQQDVSRKFIYQQVDKAQHALQHTFAPTPTDESVFFHLPVTKAWLQQLTLGLVLICHSSYRGVIELFHDLFDYPVSLGAVHDLIQQAVPHARQHNDRLDLSSVRIGAHDEIFQAGRPVLVGCDADSTYCYLLSPEEHRDADTWGLRLLELVQRGFAPQATVADGGTGLRAGQQMALPGVPCRGDVFHALYELGPVVRFLENRAYQAIADRSKLEEQLARPGKRRDRLKSSLTQKLRYARPGETQAIVLAEDVALLLRWLREDVLAVAGVNHAGRSELYDFIRTQLRARESQCPHRLGPVCTALANQRDDLLAFVAQLDRDLAVLAQECAVPVALTWEMLQVQALSPHDIRRGPREAALRNVLRGRFHLVSTCVEALVGRVVRASSVVENVNSRLRNYFFLRRQVGEGYLSLVQFFLNHRRFLRSERPARVGKSPAELLTGESHGHWLELLGYQRFSRN